MCPALTDKRHERFSRLIADGAALGPAYRKAGFASANAGAAHRLKNRAEIAARIAEIIDARHLRVAAVGEPPTDRSHLSDFERAAWLEYDDAVAARDHKRVHAVLKLLAPKRTGGRPKKDVDQDPTTERSNVEQDPTQAARVAVMLERVAPGKTGLEAVKVFLDKCFPPWDQPEERRRRALCRELGLPVLTPSAEAHRQNLIRLTGCAPTTGLWMGLHSLFDLIAKTRVVGGDVAPLYRAFDEAEGAKLVAEGRDVDWAEWPIRKAGDRAHPDRLPGDR